MTVGATAAIPVTSVPQGLADMQTHTLRAGAPKLPTSAAFASMVSQESQTTAFRVEEKRYQLHKEQQIRYRSAQHSATTPLHTGPDATCCNCSKGRKHGGKLIALPTDFTKVLDFNTSTTKKGSGVQRRFSKGLDKPVFSLASHPGRLQRTFIRIRELFCNFECFV